MGVVDRQELVAGEHETVDVDKDPVVLLLGGRDGREHDLAISLDNDSAVFPDIVMGKLLDVAIGYEYRVLQRSSEPCKGREGQEDPEYPFHVRGLPGVLNVPRM